MGELRWRLAEQGELEAFWDWIIWSRLRSHTVRFDAERALVSFDIEFAQSDESEVERRWLVVRLTRTPIVVYRLEVSAATGLEPLGPDPEDTPFIASLRPTPEEMVFDCMDDSFGVRGRELVATAVRCAPSGWVEWKWGAFAWRRLA